MILIGRAYLHLCSHPSRRTRFALTLWTHGPNSFIGDFVTAYFSFLTDNIICKVHSYVSLLFLFQAELVNHHTKKVLHMGVKNKYCTPCARAISVRVKILNNILTLKIGVTDRALLAWSLQ